jgi:lipoate-protein ligase A
MLFVDNQDVTDARLNLALEEYVLRNKMTDEDILLFYVNSPSIIIGRNQNTIEEIDSDVVAARHIQVVRRISGGGAVYHDLGNLNFSFMTRDVHGRFNRYDTFNGPVVEVLRGLGVPAELSGRNDILAGGRKISGNAQFASAGRMFSHGTLLLNANLDDVTAALRPKPGKLESKAMKSVRSRVANISEFLATPLDVRELRELILERIFGTRDRARIPQLMLTDADWEGARQLFTERYDNWDWNYGRSPASNLQRAVRFPGGEIDMRLDIQDGRITAIRLFGDYMGSGDVSEVEKRLVGLPYDRVAIVTALVDLDLGAFFGRIGRDEVLGVICP